jgi:hypothetical protein
VDEHLAGPLTVGRLAQAGHVAIRGVVLAAAIAEISALPGEL